VQKTYILAKNDDSTMVVKFKPGLLQKH